MLRKKILESNICNGVMNIAVSVRLQYLNVNPNVNSCPCSASQPQRSDLQPKFSQLLAALRNSGRSLQKICQILSSSSIPSLQSTLCLAGYC